MTHDELLEEIDEAIADFDLKFDNSNPYYKALRAVVEMHYPWEITWAVKQPFIACYSCAEIYPCPTIETIMEELGCIIHFWKA